MVEFHFDTSNKKKRRSGLHFLISFSNFVTNLSVSQAIDSLRRKIQPPMLAKNEVAQTTNIYEQYEVIKRIIIFIFRQARFTWSFLKHDGGAPLKPSGLTRQAVL